MMRWLMVVLALVCATALQAREAAPMAEDPVIEARLIAISEEMRCMVCQNESLAGSRADLAEDLRREIRSLMRQGKSDQEVMEFLVSRYGDFVRYRPPFKPLTWALWVGPFLLLLAAIVIVARRVRHNTRQNGAAASTADEATASAEAERRERARALLKQTQDRS